MDVATAQQALFMMGEIMMAMLSGGYARLLVASKISRVIVTYCNSDFHSLMARV